MRSHCGFDEGGMEIEKVAHDSPDKIITIPIDPRVGLQPFQSMRLALGLKLEVAKAPKLAEVVGQLYKMFIEKDCSMLEVNPLV
jgi:succinyl-CoA synthetase beta subunit